MFLELHLHIIWGKPHLDEKGNVIVSSYSSHTTRWKIEICYLHNVHKQYLRGELFLPKKGTL